MSEKSIFNRLGISLAVFVVIWVGLQILLGRIVGIFFPNALDMEWLYWLISSGPMYLVAFPVVLKMLKKLPSRQLYEHKLEKNHFIQIFFMTMALMLIGNIIGLIFTTVLTRITGIQFAVSVSETLFGYKLSWIFLITVIIAPIVEEILFRKVLIDRMIVFGDGAAIFLSALMFGLIHGNFSQFFYAFFIGLMFGFLYVRTGKVKYTIGLHMLFNFCGGFVPAVFLKQLDAFSLMDGSFTAIFDHLGSLLGLLAFEMASIGCGIAGVVLLIVNRKKIWLNQGELQMTKGELVKSMFATPGIWLCLVVIVLLFVLNIVSI